MVANKRPVQVQIPSRETDAPKLGHIGVIAALCFAIGVAWPTLAGVRLVPYVPGQEPTEDDDPKASPRPEKKQTPERPSKAVPVAKNLGAQVLDEEARQTRVQIEKRLTVNCRDEEDRRLNECDTPGFDSVAEDRLKALITCKGADSANGDLSIGFELDFKAEKIRKILRGKSTTLDDQLADDLVQCAKREFMSATLKDVSHTHSRYLLFYVVRFAPPGTGLETDGAPTPVVKASGSATIIWNSAIVRDSEENGEVKARLLYGTKVFVTGRRGDWYRVKYDARGTEGWIHKNALAM